MKKRDLKKNQDFGALCMLFKQGFCGKVSELVGILRQKAADILNNQYYESYSLLIEENYNHKYTWNKKDLGLYGEFTL